MRAEMHAGDANAVAGHPDVRHQAFVARREHRLEGTTGADRHLPLVGFDEIVELDQVDAVDAHPFERPLELGACRATGPLARLRGEEHLVAVFGQPRPQPILRRAVAGGGVDVVDSPLVHLRERGVGTRLAHPPERGGAEDHSCRAMAGGAELGGRE